MSADAVAARRAFFGERFPAVAARLEHGSAHEFDLVVKGGEAVDIRVGEQEMYGGDARRFSRDQVAAYMEKPLRLFMNRLNNTGLLSAMCIRLVGAFNAHLSDEGVNELSSQPVVKHSFVIVFGLGLGHHLEALAARTEARWLVLVEPFVGFFTHSFEVVDWPALVDRFEQRGGGVHIVTELDPGAIAAGITRFMNAQGIAYADGSWIFTHYPLWAFQEARKRLHEAVEFAFVNRGFFEDELRMMENAVTNFAQHEFRLLEGKPRLERHETAVIVGAGPSLDECIELLFRIRDRVVLYSCGTALRPLLRHGLVPDFHCELENVPEVNDVISETAQYGNLKAVTLVASATVDPRVPPHFGKTVFFFRDSVSSTVILGRSFRVLPGVSPTCVNVGLAAAAYMGLKNIVLVGTDCGVRAGAKVHAEGTIYRDIGVWKDKDARQKHPIELEGNFGGVVRTDWVYDACRLMLASMIGFHRFNIINCSDGALIPGARPCAPEALEVPGPAVDRDSFTRALERGMRLFAPGEMMADSGLAAAREGARALFDQLDNLLCELAANEPDFAAAYDRIRSFLAATGDTYRYSDSLVSGTLAGLPRIAMFYGFRIADEAARRRVYDRYIAEFRAIVGEMAERTAALFDRLERIVARSAEALAVPAE